MIAHSSLIDALMHDSIGAVIFAPICDDFVLLSIVIIQFLSFICSFVFFTYSHNLFLRNSSMEECTKNSHEQCLPYAGRFCGYTEQRESRKEEPNANTEIEPDLRLQYDAPSFEGA